MSDYDAVFASAVTPGPSPYDDVMKAVVATIKPQALPSADAPTAVQAGAAVNSIPRQLGLTARYGLEGLANFAQIGTEPLRYLTDRLTGQTGKTLPLGALVSKGLDSIGLPSPQNADERVVGDATRLVAGAGAGGALSQLAARGAPAVTSFVAENASKVIPQRVTDFIAASKQVPSMLSSNMPQQLASAAGAGLAGGASREAGGSPLMQGAAALAGGVAGGMAPGGVSAAVNGVRSAFNKLTPQQLDQQINIMLERSGVDYSQFPERVRQALRADVQSAMNTGREIDPTSLSRLADFRMVGATPTRGMVSQNPVQITREMNLSKIGANTGDDALQGLPLLQNQNNATFIRNLNDQGAQRGNIDAAGQAVTSAVTGTQQGLRAAERGAWNAARNSPGYTQPIEANVISNINRTLGEEGMMPFLNPTISRYMESFMTGQQPFTPQAYRNLQSMLSNEMSRGGNEAAAAGAARRVLEASQLRPITNPTGVTTPVTAGVAGQLRALDAQPGQAIDAVNQARAATRAAYAYEDSNPLVRSVLSNGASGDPTRIAQRFVIGGTPREAEMLAQEVGVAGRGPVRDAIVAHLKEKSLNGATDEVGKFSQSAYNKALTAIGDRKLSLFFAPEEIAQLRALGRVSSLAQSQPVGSAVNNSNSGALVVGKGLDALRAFGESIPVVGPMAVQPLANGIQGLNVTLRTRQAQNAAQGLLMAPQKPPMGQGLLLPGIAAGGLLAGQ